MACRVAKVEKSTDMATLEMLAVATSKMRKIQVAYFSKRTNALLKEAKDAEAEVDQLLRELAPTNVAIAANVLETKKPAQTSIPFG